MIEFIIIAAAVYGARQAWLNGTRAASRALGSHYEKTRQKLASKPAFNWFGESGPKVAAGLATATYGSVLAPRAFFRDWKVNWREGVERARARYGSKAPATENEKREETVLGAPAGSENAASENPSAEAVTASEKADPLAQFNENLDAATEKFKGGAFSGEGSSEKPEPEPQREAPPLTPEEAEMAQCEEQEAEEMRLQAQGQGMPHTYVTSTNDEAPMVGARNGSSMSTDTVGDALNLESLRSNVDTLAQYTTTESDAARTNVAAYSDLVKKLENISGQLKSLDAQGVASHVQAAMEALQVADAGAQQINTGLDNARAAIRQLEQDCQDHQRVAEARASVEDKTVDASFYATS